MNMFSKMWFPAAVVSIAIAGTVATTDHVESTYLVEDPLERFEPDTVKYPVAGYKLRRRGNFDAETLPDSVLRALGITLTFEDEENDSIPRLTARDTIPVPDSLREIDPFRYKYYVALFDSLTHRIVSDSLRKSYFDLMEAEDTLQARLDSADRYLLDSLYYRDSTIRAKEAFLAWYNGLSKEERKKYDYEQKIKLKMARNDSVRKVKEKRQAERDSIVETTPRVLETFAIPDTMQFQRVITWKVDPDFHDVRAHIPDTNFNYWFYDYAFRRKDVNATWLGVAGSPVQYYNYFERSTDDMPEFYKPYESWSRSVRTFDMYNSKTPYTELAYWGTLFANQDKESDNLHLFTTQNITPAFNYSLLYERWGGGGMLNKENTSNKTFAFGTNYLGKRYLAHAGFINNVIAREENGGLTDNYFVRDTTLDAREMRIRMTDATSNVKKQTFFLDQQYCIPFSFINDIRAARDSTFVPDTTFGSDITTAFIGHSTEYSTYRRDYKGPSSAVDTTQVKELDNKLFIRLQPWKSDAAISKLDVGIGDRIQTFYDPEADGSRVRKNSFYTYAGANGRLFGDMTWDAKAKYYLQGYHAGDFLLQANAAYSIYPFRKARKSPVSIHASFEERLFEPDYYQQKAFSTNYTWSNEFGKTSVTKLRGGVDVPYWGLSADVGYALLVNNIYYDTLGVAKQNSSAVSVLSASLRKDFVIADLVHLDNRMLLQLSSDDVSMPVPVFALNGKYFLQFVVARDDYGQKVLDMQLGANVFWNTAWYSPGWNPELGVFYNQREYKYNNGPIIDLFMNMQWKKACIFVKWENFNKGWPLERPDYFSAHHYINTQRAIKLGIFWPFYVMPGKSGSSSSSSSGFSAADAAAGSAAAGGQSSFSGFSGTAR